MAERYVLIVGHAFHGMRVTRLLGCVGIILSSEDRQDGNGMMFSIKIGTEMHLFHGWNIESITKKEYFKGCLGG